MTPESHRRVARRLYDLPDLCESCQLVPPVDRHHKDGDPGNNIMSSIAFLCRSCHMYADGRLAALRKSKQRAKARSHAVRTLP